MLEEVLISIHQQFDRDKVLLSCTILSASLGLAVQVERFLGVLPFVIFTFNLLMVTYYLSLA